MTDLTHLQAEMTEWRRDFHRHPEFGFEEHRTAGLVADRLRAFGLEVETGVGGTGVVGTLTRGTSNRSIALRADMDALRIQEATNAPYASSHDGTMHACGHDGHTAMLLGAAKLLSEEGGFDGTVRFIFQPAEEWGQGALAMLEDGLLQRFPFDEIYGIHNMPGYDVGQFRTRPGPVMSAEDTFEITLTGSGGHASRPDKTQEVMVAACALVLNLQTIVSRRLSPTDIGVVSVTEILSDGVRNALPGTARILGDTRSFTPEVSAEIETNMAKIAAGTASAYGVLAAIEYRREFIPTVNDPNLTKAVMKAAATIFGQNNTAELREPISASEDFAQFLAHVPGCFMFLGNGKDSKALHHPEYDFNDRGLIHGTKLHRAIARERLPIIT
ncbi:M20 aminoacylase family protein [Donghicola tyrosinivorans]|nr:M20 aminoacylase family protein [Donghicola tyrosinivorans]